MAISEISHAIKSRDPFYGEYQLIVNDIHLSGCVRQIAERMYLLTINQNGQTLFHKELCCQKNYGVESMEARILLCRKMRELTSTIAPSRNKKPLPKKENEVLREQLFEIDAIKYRGGIVDYGVILTQRKARWTLCWKFSPCYVTIKGGAKISAVSPQKSNCTVYIPRDSLKVGELIRIHQQEYQQPLHKWHGVVLEKGANFVKFGVTKDEHIERKPKQVKMLQSENYNPGEVVF